MVTNNQVSICRRCQAIGCEGELAKHQNWYTCPPSRQKEAPRHCNTGDWCECCLRLLWDGVKPETRAFLGTMAAHPGLLSIQLTAHHNPRSAALDITKTARRLGIAVRYPQVGEVWHHTWPYSFDELVLNSSGERKPKKYRLPKEGAILIRKFRSDDDARLE